MTTLTSQIPDVWDYLVTQCQAATFPAGTETGPVVIHDGPQVTADDLSESRHLWIGHNPAQLYGGEPTATAEQEFALSMDQGRTRDERPGVITCAADAWGGSTTLKTWRDDCAAIIGVVELLLRGLPSNGGPGDYTMGGLVLWSQLTGPFEWAPRQVQDGAGMLCVFRIQYYARLTTGS